MSTKDGFLSNQFPDGARTTISFSDDHLGSGSTTTYMNTATTPVNLSYGPFGNRRDANWQGFPNLPAMTAVANTTRTGFAGHTMLDNLGLIHMRGRVKNARWADLYQLIRSLPTCSNPQSHNPYSYVVNDPLSLTDPSVLGQQRSTAHRLVTLVALEIVPAAEAAVWVSLRRVRYRKPGGVRAPPPMPSDALRFYAVQLPGKRIFCQMVTASTAILECQKRPMMERTPPGGAG